MTTTDPLTHSPAFGLPLAAMDPALADLLAQEERRNLATVNLIASESYCPRSTLEAEASLLVNKNAYGYPGARGVAGCAVFDRIETLALERACRLFGAERANIQALSSTIANIAVMRALVPPGGTILAFDESAGGHHSHGADYHLAGRDYRVVRFGADEAAGTLDLDAARRLAREHEPAVIVAGSTSFPRAIDFTALSGIARETGARLFADIAHVSGLVAAGLLPSPASCADVVTTSTHKTFCGPRTGGLILSQADIADAIDRELFPGLQGAPGAHIVAARAALFHFAGTAEFRGLMAAILRNAAALADVLSRAGMTLYLGGTDTHMVVVDLRHTAIDALELERTCERHGLMANRVSLPSRPGDVSRAGLRLGTTAMSIRGIGPQDLAALGEIVGALIDLEPGRDDAGLRERIAGIARRCPIPEAFLPHWFSRPDARPA